MQVQQCNTTVQCCLCTVHMYYTARFVSCQPRNRSRSRRCQYRGAGACKRYQGYQLVLLHSVVKTQCCQSEDSERVVHSNARSQRSDRVGARCAPDVEPDSYNAAARLVSRCLTRVRQRVDGVTGIPSSLYMPMHNHAAAARCHVPVDGC